jgi:hypothetical protein
MSVLLRDINVPLYLTCFSDLLKALLAYINATLEKTFLKVLGIYLHIFYNKS